MTSDLKHWQCKYCKVENREQLKFCWSCGTKRGQDQPKSLPVIGKIKRGKKPKA